MSQPEVERAAERQLKDQDRTSTDARTPRKENLDQAGKLSSQDSQSCQRPALQENVFQPLLTPGGPLALSPPRTLRSSQKWGSLSASRILGLSPNASRLRGKSLVLSPMCSRAAPASQGQQPQTGASHLCNNPSRKQSPSWLGNEVVASCFTQSWPRKHRRGAQREVECV